MRVMAGFTLVELVAVMVILGVLAAVALPRISGISDYRSAAFHDNAIATLRFAQKTAISHRRMVCVAFTASTVTLTIDHDRSGACDGQVLNLPGSNNNVLTSSDTTNAVFNPVPTDFNFQPNGTGADRTISMTGQANVVVVGASGHVH